MAPRWGGINDAFSGAGDIIDYQTALVEYEGGANLAFHTNLNVPDEFRRFCRDRARRDGRGGLHPQLLSGDAAPTAATTVVDEAEVVQGRAAAGITARTAQMARRHHGAPARARSPSCRSTCTDALEAGVTALAMDQARLEGRVVDLAETWAEFDAGWGRPDDRRGRRQGVARARRRRFDRLSLPAADPGRGADADHRRLAAGRDLPAQSFTDAILRGEEYVGAENYVEIFEDDFWEVMRRTFLWMGLGVSLKIIVGTIGAVLLNAALPGRALFRILVMPPWIVPIAIGVFMWSWLYNGQFGMISGLAQRIGLIDGPFEFLAYPHARLPRDHRHRRLGRHAPGRAVPAGGDAVDPGRALRGRLDRRRGRASTASAGSPCR